MNPQWPRIKSVSHFRTIIRTRHSHINSKNAPRARVISTMAARVTTRLRTVVTRAASPCVVLSSVEPQLPLWSAAPCLTVQDRGIAMPSQARGTSGTARLHALQIVSTGARELPRRTREAARGFLEGQSTLPT